MKYDKTYSIEPTQKVKSITFFEGKNEMIKLEKGSFYFKGEKITDVNEVYERFNSWLKCVEFKSNDPSITK